MADVDPTHVIPPPSTSYLIPPGEGGGFSTLLVSHPVVRHARTHARTVDLWTDGRVCFCGGGGILCAKHVEEELVDWKTILEVWKSIGSGYIYRDQPCGA